MIIARENKYSKEKKCLIVTLSATRLAWNDPGLILGLIGERLVTSCLNRNLSQLYVKFQFLPHSTWFFSIIRDCQCCVGI